MYDQTIISEYLSKLRPSVTINPGTKKEKVVPFDLRELSIQQSLEFTDYLNSKIDFELYENTCSKHKDKVQLKFKPDYKPSEEDSILIENERLLCKWNYIYWSERYYKILNHENVWVQFSPNTSQRINTRIFARQQKKRLALRKFTLKARQGGETTDSQGRLLHRMNYFNDARCLISSKDQIDTDRMSQMLTGALDKLPYWNRTFRERYEQGSFFEFDIDSFLDLGYGTQKSIGRGRTPTLYHGSEIPFYADPQKSLQEGLFKAMHENIWMLQKLEGTAEVRGDWFHIKWKEFVEGMEKGTSSMIAVFHPWVYRTDIYPTPAWLRARQEYFSTWIPKTETLSLARAIESWIKINPDAVAELGSNYTVPLEQLFFYEVEREAAERANQLHKFLKEMPSTPEQAFQHAGHTMYPVKLILSISDEAQQNVPDVYKLKGDPNEISPLLFPTSDELHDSGERIKIKARWASNMPSFDYELVRIKFEGWDRFDPINKILIWEHPQKWAKYGAGVDTSDGLGALISDNAVLEMLKAGTVEYKDKQVCEFASPELPQNLLWPFVYAIMTYYSQEEQALLIPEINKGTELLNAMVNRGWGNVFKMLDPSKIGQDQSTLKKFGFETNNKTRPALIEHMNSFIVGEWIELNSIPLIEEIKDLEKIRSLTSTLGFQREKISGKADDRFMATAICLYGLHRDSLIGLQAKSWEERIRNENSTVEFAQFKEPTFDQESELWYNQERDYYHDEADNLVEIYED